MSTHTPGPWEVSSAAHYEEGKLMEPIEYFVRQVGADVAIADMVDTEANARLMAAAPDMLAAAKELLANFLPALEHYYNAEDDAEYIAPLRAAIAKAEGRP